MVTNVKNKISKVTPLHDLSWYVKWVSSIIIISGMILSSLNLYPYNLFVHALGVTGWLWVGFLWHDRALIVVNAVAIAIFVLGIGNYYVGGAYP